MLREEDIKHFQFYRLKKNSWIGWEDYLLSNINPEYGYFTCATLHYPNKNYVNSGRLEDKFIKIIIHRHYNLEEPFIDEHLDEGESEVIFKGKVNSREEFEILLKQLGI